MSVANDKITIVIVDDDMDAIESEITEIKLYLKEKVKEYELLTDESGDKIDEFLENYKIDIVLTDKRIGNEDSGLKVIEKVRNKSDLIDILLYSAKGITFNDYKQAQHYTAVSVVDDKTISDPTKTLIDRFLAKWDDMIFLRGIAISKVIELESEINFFLERYFYTAPHEDTRFRNFVLENRHVSLEAKKKILSKIRDHEKIDFEGLGKLNKLQENRNYLAHCDKHDSINNCLIHMGDDEKFTRDRMNGIFAMISEFSDDLKNFEGKIMEKRNSA